MAGRSIIGGFTAGGGTLIDSGAKAGATTYTSPAWAASQYDVIECWARLGSVNGGALFVPRWRFQGTTTGTYANFTEWGGGAGGLTMTVSGAQAGTTLMAADQLNVAVTRVVHGIWFPKMRFGQVQTYSLMASNDLQFAESAGASTDMSNAVTGLIFDFQGITVAITDMLMVGASF